MYHLLASEFTRLEKKMLVSLQCKLLYDIADKMILRLYFSIFREISCLASASHFPFFVWKMFFPFI